MSSASDNAVFKTAKVSPTAKAEITNSEVNKIVAAELVARLKKTAKLKLLREERDAAAPAPEPKPARKKKA